MAHLIVGEAEIIEDSEEPTECKRLQEKEQRGSMKGKVACIECGHVIHDEDEQERAYPLQGKSFGCTLQGKGEMK